MQLITESNETILDLPPEQTCYRFDLWAYFENRIGFEQEGSLFKYKKDPAAWQEVNALIAKQLQGGENFRYHVAGIVRRAWWISQGMIIFGIAGGVGFVLLLMNIDEPKEGVLRFLYRYGIKLGFVILIAMVAGGLAILYDALRASCKLRRMTRADEWQRPG